MFGTDDLKKLVECAKNALEAEDHYLSECAKNRKWPPGRNGMYGLRCNTNERYYQFVIWRELLASFRWRPETEREAYDLVFYDGTEAIAYAEIKGWWSSGGDVSAIRQDIALKLGRLRVPGVMLVLTSHAKAEAEENFKYLADELGRLRNDLIDRSFNTPSWRGKPMVFSVVGLLVPNQLAK